MTGRLLSKVCHARRIPKCAIVCWPQAWTSCTHVASRPVASRTSLTRPVCPRAPFTRTSRARRRSARPSSTTIGQTSRRGCCRSSTRTGRAQERIQRFFHALADEHEAGDFLLGCLIGNLSLELGGSSEPVRAELTRILERWDDALTACVRSGQRRSGDVRADLDASRARLPADRGVGGRGPAREGDPQSRPVRPVRSGHRPGPSPLSWLVADHTDASP